MRLTRIVALFAGIVGCSSYAGTPGEPPAGSDAGPTAPPGCDTNADPKDAPACVVDGFGLFVDASNGKDDAAGTKGAPLKTIGAALGRSGKDGRIYVCEGTYAEHVTVTSNVALIGGFSCSNWTYAGTKARILPADAGVALRLRDVGAALISDFMVEANSGSEALPSSVAVALIFSAATFLRVDIVAGDGFAGVSQQKAESGALASSSPTANTLNGNDGGDGIGGPAQFCTCVGGGTSKGGAGGGNTANGEGGEAVQTSPDPVTALGARGLAADCRGASSIAARRGSNAPHAPAALGASRLGSVVNGEWTPGAGSSGKRGTPGQGGGGGGGSDGDGSSGACGGCGGAGALGGGGGGGSIGILSEGSQARLVASTLVSGAGGTGGVGASGGDGGAGGTGGSGGSGCTGGNGGRGGNGGAGGGGAGGISVGILFQGTAPTLEGTAVVNGTRGRWGFGGAPGVNDGMDGIAAPTLEAP